MPGTASIRWNPTSLSKLLESILYHWDIVPNDAQASAMAADVGEGVTPNAIKSKISILKRKTKTTKPGKKLSPVKPSARKLTPLSPSVTTNRVTKRQRPIVLHSSEDESTSNHSITLDEAEAEASETVSGEENAWKSEGNGTDATDDQGAVKKSTGAGTVKRTASARRAVKKVDYKALNGESTESEDEEVQSQDWWLKGVNEPVELHDEDDENVV